MSFINFARLTENENERKTAVFAFGRMNPVTKGHGALIEAVHRVAGEKGGDALIFPSRTHDPKKNPLEPSEKIEFLREAFPGVKFVDDETVRNPFSSLRYLLQRGYTDLVIVAGSDRVPDYEKGLREAALKTFQTCEVVSAGTRDPDAEDVSGMSGTKAREAAASGDLGKFRANTGWSGEFSIRLMQAVRRGMGYAD